jgi:hypothetical protein
MSEHDDFKTSLLNVSWRLYKKVEIQSTLGSVPLEIRMPPPGVLSALLAKAKAVKTEAGSASPEASADGAQEFAMEVIATTVWRPGAIRQLFTPDEVRSWPYASAIQADCLAALSAATGMESAKGNSEATPA